MASRGQSCTVSYYAYDTGNTVGKVGDLANHTLRIAKDGGTPAAPTNTPTEVDATNLKGSYQVVLTAAECTANFLLLGGISSTSGIVIYPTLVSFEQLPTAAPNANGGLPILSSSGTTLGYTISTLTTYTGNTLQTGDNFPRLGAPTGASIAADIQTRATSSQIPANFTTATFASAGVFATAALANAPTGSGASPSAIAAAILAQTLSSPRALDSVADAALTVNDALVAATSGAAGKEAVSGSSFVVKTPAGTTIRTFTLDSATAPTSRN